ncbi:MAG TPA: hypothetical protein VNR11_07655 [Xanthobacteraceae bacterium]|nr:hypothetical protein [Xanthobacteraceae bacterium]
MCMACQEAELYYRWQLLEQIAKGEMPQGMSEDDLRAMDMPLPGEIELVEAPDGQVIIRKTDKFPRKAAKPEAFACDSPDSE